jgi:hypothetical protein
MLLYIVVFILFLGSVIYNLGRSLLNRFKLNLNFSEQVSLSLCIGLVVFTLEVYLTGLMGSINFLLPVIAIQSAVLGIWGIKTSQFIISNSNLGINFPSILVIALSVYLTAFHVYPFGVIDKDRLPMYGANLIDNTWHLSLINSLQKQIPPENPLFYGHKLTNYHYFVDLQISAIQAITKIPLPILYFRIIGPSYFFLLATLVYILGMRLTNTFGGIMAVLFCTISSNGFYLARLFSNNPNLIPSVAWVDVYSTKAVNYPLAFSLAVLITIIYILVHSQLNLKSGIIITLIIGSLFAFKAHTSLILLYGLFNWGIYSAKNKNYSILFVTATSSLLTLYFIFTTSGDHSQSLIFSPLWFIKSMYESKDHLNNVDWELKRQFLVSQHGWLGVVKLYVIGLLGFILINFHVIYISVANILIRSRGQQYKSINLFLLNMIVIGILIPMLFIYKYSPIVMMEFIYLSIFLMGLLMALLFGNLLALNKRLVVIFAGILCWTMLLPGVRYSVNNFQANINYTPVNPQFIQAITHLKNLPGTRIVADPSFFPGSVLTAYANKSVYVGDLLILSGLGIDHSTRSQQAQKIFDCSDKSTASTVLSQVTPNYIFANADADCFKDYDFLKQVFVNNKVSIYSYKQL